jgi:hypothetical protein
MKTKKMMPRKEENDWIKNPQPSYDSYSFDIKPSYNSPVYDMDIDQLGVRGERPHPVPKYAGLSGYSTDAKRKIAWYNSKIKAAKSAKEKQFYISKLNAYKKSLVKPKPVGTRTAVLNENREKIVGGLILFGLGYVVLNEIFG